MTTEDLDCNIRSRQHLEQGDADTEYCIRKRFKKRRRLVIKLPKERIVSIINVIVIQLSRYSNNFVNSELTKFYVPKVH